jgi:NTE family protein
MTDKKSSGKPLTTTDFTNHPKVVACLKDLTGFFDGTNPLVVSDVLDAEGHQYVELVQKGGGVLGVALVGYTYVLEMMGIRFLRLAGTSAGAINTALMTIIDRKEDAKSTKILEIICALDFFKLVDGHPAARWLIKNFITRADFLTQVKKWLLIVGCLLGILISTDILLLGLQHSIPILFVWTDICFILTGVFLLLVLIGSLYVGNLLKRLKDSGYGINPGDYFYDWLKDQFKANKVNTVSDLNCKASQPIPGLAIRPGTIHPEGLQDLAGNVTFISSELVTENKIQFPAMCNLFRPSGRINELQPAGFVRASMSIPLFFESYMITDIPDTDPEVRKAWLETFEVDQPPRKARFVDGGILSNFPINLFYNPAIIIPRLPVFGIDLDDTKAGDKVPTPATWSLFGYLGRIFNTVRDYYDKDFLIKNKVFGKGIGKIQLADFNWLNFFLTPEDKINMFIRGAETACEFLKKFDWNEYKTNRGNMQKEINASNKPLSPNNKP